MGPFGRSLSFEVCWVLIDLYLSWYSVRCFKIMFCWWDNYIAWLYIYIYIHQLRQCSRLFCFLLCSGCWWFVFMFILYDVRKPSCFCCCSFKRCLWIHHVAQCWQCFRWLRLANRFSLMSIDLLLFYWFWLILIDFWWRATVWGATVWGLQSVRPIWENGTYSRV